MAGRDRDGRRDQAESGRDVGFVGPRHTRSDAARWSVTAGASHSQHGSREGQTFAHRGSRWLVYVNFVKLPHTLFALPFALVGVVLASYRAPVTWGVLGWVVL